MIIGNIYAPTQDNEDEQIMLIEQLNVMLNNFQDRNIILGGDFNVYIDPKLDKKGGNLHQISRYSNFLSTFNEEFNLIDTFRTLNPRKHEIYMARQD